MKRTPAETGYIVKGQLRVDDEFTPERNTHRPKPQHYPFIADHISICQAINTPAPRGACPRIEAYCKNAILSAFFSIIFIK
ncbi:MAG: hypothetical protein GXP08_15440 [Gammaproteobacteria bacterium]|nr:hypothetical protein [Gammaproteobacteria bacterium]